MARLLSLDPAQTGLVAVQSFRGASITSHLPRSVTWKWAPRARMRATTAVIFASDGTLGFAERDRVEPARPMAGILLHSTHAGFISWSPGASATIVWLDTDSVVESGVSEAARPLELWETTLTTGFRAFAKALLQGAQTTSTVTAYVVERLLHEMALAILLERSDFDVPSTAPDQPIRRARALMLLNRNDPDYGVDELANDLHVSLRQLQRTFSQAGTTPASALRSLRVELAESLLRDPQYDSLSIPELARHAGFANAPAMRRALQAEERATPQKLRVRV